MSLKFRCDVTFSDVINHALLVYLRSTTAPLPILPMSVPNPPVEFQLVRNPRTGRLLLLPTSGTLLQAMVWPSYIQPSSHLLLPQIPPPPLQLLRSANTSATAFTNQLAVQPFLAAHLIYQLPIANLILSQTPTTTITVQPTLETTSCRSQVPFPDTFTPPPENNQDQLTHHQNQQQQCEEKIRQVQDVCNQTDTVEYLKRNVDLEKKANGNNGVMEGKCNDTTREKEIVPPISLLNQIKENEINLISKGLHLKPSDFRTKEVESAQLVGKKENVKCLPLDLQVKVNDECNEDDSSAQSKDFRINSKNNHDENKSSQKVSAEISEKPDTTGLDLLSSLVNIENRINIENNNINEVEKNVEDKFGGLNLLCALAEQRILEEVSKQKRREIAIEKSDRMEEKLKNRGNRDPDEPKQKKFKYDINEKGEKIIDKIEKDRDDKSRKNCSDNKIKIDGKNKIGEEKFKQDKVKKAKLKEERFREEKVKEKCKKDKIKENKLIENKFNENKLNEHMLKDDKLKREILKLCQRKLSQENIVENPQKIVKKEIKDIDDPCQLKPDDLDKTRVLTTMGGLYFSWELKAIEPPDVYSITLAGERGNQPHIMPREDILRDAILEVHLRNEEELTVGTRVAAYRSQKYRCLYPGSVAEPDSPTSKLISVDFDDGVKGKISLKDIRLLPPDYRPGLAVHGKRPKSKRKNGTSRTEDSSNSTNTESTIQEHYC